jgi:DNA-binding NtrC family response regulator
VRRWIRTSSILCINPLLPILATVQQPGTHVTIPDASVLIVDDDVEFAHSAADYARAHGFSATLAHTVEQSREAMRREDPCDLFLLEENLPDGSCFDLIEDLTRDDQTRVAIVTGEPTAASAWRAKALPILDYVVKPLRPLKFDALLAAASAAQLGRYSIADAPGGLFGECQEMRSIIRQVFRIAPAPANVLVVGETGTGKELVARALHEHSGRCGPFVAVNCGAIPTDLLASHIFGHERGSFTGATARHIGYFEQAHGGTLFLDEITEMPSALQVYLLRALEAEAITRVGGNAQVPTDVRVIAATNRNPGCAMEAGQLREDLFYRLADFVMDLPPLRRRGSDLPMLAQLFVHRLNIQYGKNKQLDLGFSHSLFQYDWPGNVRELRSAVLRAFLASDDGWVRVVPDPGRLGASQGRMRSDDEPIVFEVGTAYAEVAKEMLLRTLAHFNQDKARTAAALGVSVRTIHNQLARMRI